MSKPSNGTIIQKGDVVWVQYRKDPLWPALVHNVYPKKLTYAFFPLPKVVPGAKKQQPFSCNPNIAYALSTDDKLPEDCDMKLIWAYDAAVEYLIEKKTTLGSNAPRRPDLNAVNMVSPAEALKKAEALEKKMAQARKAEEEAEALEREETTVAPRQGSRVRFLDGSVATTSQDYQNDEEEQPVAKKRKVIKNEHHEESEEDVVAKEQPIEEVEVGKSDELKMDLPEKGEEPKTEPQKEAEELKMPLNEKKKIKVDPLGKNQKKKAKRDASEDSDIVVVKKALPESKDKVIYVEDFPKMVFERCDSLLTELWGTPIVRKYSIPDRAKAHFNLYSAKVLTNDDTDRLFEHIFKFVQTMETECRTLPAMLLASEVLFPEVIIRCTQEFRGMSYEQAKLSLMPPVNGVDAVFEQNGTSPTHQQISGLDALVRVACEERAKTAAAHP